MSILVFDSGIGGLGILRELRIVAPDERVIYVGDDAGFPYGDWDEQLLTQRIVKLFDYLLDRYSPTLAIVACNTASTSIMPALRQKFETPFVGTVPAIKPAAERTASGMVTLLGTPATVTRSYIKNLIAKFAADIEVELVGARGLALIAENYLLQHQSDDELLSREIGPCFVQSGDRRTDIVILGCTHYPFLANQMRKLAPWPVDWIDPAEAIAQRTLAVLGSDACKQQETDSMAATERLASDIALMTSGQPASATRHLLLGFGLHTEVDTELIARARSRQITSHKVAVEESLT